MNSGSVATKKVLTVGMLALSFLEKNRLHKQSEEDAVKRFRNFLSLNN